MTDLTLAQKASLVVGAGFWGTVPVDAAGIRSVTLADGPHGIRRQPDGGDHLGLGGSLPATCFPPAAGLASSWNPALVERVGRALGIEARAQGVDVLLGPGVNIKRDPRCGRNFEYFAEDPLLAGELGGAWVHGIQSTGVGASLKHFAANNQETDRMTVSAEVDERTLRELYLPAFEHIVTQEQPWTVMCAYNRLNGVYAAENRWLLTDVLRGEWGFRGLVVSDWGAVDRLVPSIAAGLDLEMPGPQPGSVDSVIAAVRSGALAEADLDTAVARVRSLAARAGGIGEPFDVDEHHALAREAAAESIVLLRNEGALLPLAPGERVAVIGEFARTPRIQGAGSSQVEPTRVDAALDAIAAVAEVEFAPGYRLDGADDPALAPAAVALAARADAVLLFVGLPAGLESEGFDRTHLDLPAAQERLIEQVAAANERVVVILTNGGVVSLEPWHDSVPVIVESWLLGQAGGSAIADVLFGRSEPSGRLAESIPLHLTHTPSYLNFPGENDVVRYGEGVFVGYRYYETVERAVRYPFGHGLGYTTFELSDLRASRREASVTVTNTGDRRGSHVVQFYVAPPAGAVSRPRRELRAFEKVALEPGQSVRVTVGLDARAFAHWDSRAAGWRIPGGEYLVEVGHSAHDIALDAPVRMPQPPAPRLSLDSRVEEFLAHPVTGPLFARAANGAEEGGTDLLAMVASMPMRRLMRFPGVGDAFKRIGVLIALANNPLVRTVASWFQRR